MGKDSYAAKLTAKAKQVQEKPSEIIRGIDLIIKVAGIAIIPIGVTLFIEALVLNHKTFAEGITSSVGAVIGMIPEGLYLLVTIALALDATTEVIEQAAEQGADLILTHHPLLFSGLT